MVCELEVYQNKERERWSLPRARKRMTLDAVRLLSDRLGPLLRDGDGEGAGRPGPGHAVANPNDSDAPS
jgi:hypothetical protein